MGLGGARQALPARFLSQGQRRRLALSRLAVSHSSLWILDEVLTSLDRAAVALVEAYIGEHLDKGGMAIIATHQEYNLPTSSIQRIYLSNGPVQTGSLHSPRSADSMQRIS
jgi:heme exporter protein A